MTSPDAAGPRYVIVVAIDESALADRIIAEATSFARSKPSSEIHLVYVADAFEGADTSNEPREAFFARHRQTLERRARETRSAFDGIVVGHLGEGGAAHEIALLASLLDADLIVVGLGDHSSIERRIVGSVAMSVIERSACPVMVVRAKDHRAAHAPEIERPCPRCLETQQTSGGMRLWCARHVGRHPHPHFYYGRPEAASGLNSGLAQRSS